MATEMFVGRYIVQGPGEKPVQVVVVVNPKKMAKIATKAAWNEGNVSRAMGGAVVARVEAQLEK